MSGHRVVAEGPGGAVAEITVTPAEAGEVRAITNALALGTGSRVNLSVLGRHAVLVPWPTPAGWKLFWQADGVDVVVSVTPLVDRATVDELIAGLREAPAEEWDDLLDAGAGGSAG